jgi:hypothetical protein
MLDMARLSTWHRLTTPCGVVGAGKTKTCATMGGYSMYSLIIPQQSNAFMPNPMSSVMRTQKQKPPKETEVDPVVE